MDLALEEDCTIPHRLLVTADEDPYLDGYVDPDSTKSRTGIFLDDRLVGFFTPRVRDEYYRTGAIYIVPAHRGKGIAKWAIREYFKGRKGEACIDDDNLASLKAFQAAGFVKDKPYGLGAHWYVKELRFLEKFTG